MDAFQRLSETVSNDLFLHRHFRFVLRQARVVAYTQFLESYKSVTLDRMAEAFGVSPEFMDAEVSMFIASGKLNCTIDKARAERGEPSRHHSPARSCRAARWCEARRARQVARLLETNRPNVKNALYAQNIKNGDLILNRLQRLGRIVDL